MSNTKIPAEKTGYIVTITAFLEGYDGAWDCLRLVEHVGTMETLSRLGGDPVVIDVTAVAYPPEDRGNDHETGSPIARTQE